MCSTLGLTYIRSEETFKTAVFGSLGEPMKSLKIKYLCPSLPSLPGKLRTGKCAVLWVGRSSRNLEL